MTAPWYVFSDIRYRGCRAGRKVNKPRPCQEQRSQSDEVGDSNKHDVTTATVASETLACATHSFVVLTARVLASQAEAIVCTGKTSY